MPKLTLRLPEALHRRIVELAKAERRSINNYLIRVLEEYVQTQDRPTEPPR
jgi:predicted HicB family RNase H-like nuclease